MFNKEQVQKAIKEIDDSLASLSGSRQAHLALANDVKLVQAVCMAYFDLIERNKEVKDDGTLIPVKCPEPGNKNS